MSKRKRRIAHKDGRDRQQAMPIDEIRVGKRHRRDMGDIDALAASIEDIGLLHAITVDQDGWLRAGARRLAACKLLGWSKVPVNIVRCTR